MNYLLIFITALLVVIPASLLGVYLVQRKMVMVSDAISHAVLPGIVLAFLIVGNKDSTVLLIGAALAGMLTTFLIDIVHRKMRVQQDAAIGIVFTFLFALGVLMIAFSGGKNIDLDQECVLFGNLELSFLDQRFWGDYLIGTTSILQLTPLNILVIAFVVFAYRPMHVWAFNPDYGTSIGLKMANWQLLLMLLVSLHTVFSFHSVGAILVVGMFAIPPATASFLSKRLHIVMLLSALFAVLSCLAGFAIAVRWNISIAPTIVVMAFVFFCLVWLGTLILFSRIEKTKTSQLLESK